MLDLFAIVGLLDRCSFCFLPSESLCSWPITDYQPALVASLEVGDLCQNLGRSRIGKVARIRAVDRAGLLEVTVDRIRKVPGLARTDVYRWHRTAKVLKLTTHGCGKHCCWQHVRDLGDGKHFICSEHWAHQLAEVSVTGVELPTASQAAAEPQARPAERR